MTAEVLPRPNGTSLTVYRIHTDFV